MKKIMIAAVLLLSTLAAAAQTVKVNLYDLALKVSEKGWESINYGDYKYSCMQHALVDLALATGNKEDLKRIEENLLPFAVGKHYSFNNFISYDYGGSAAAWLAYKGVNSLKPQVKAGAADSWKNQYRSKEGIITADFRRQIKGTPDYRGQPQYTNPVFIDVAFATTPFYLYAGLAEKNQEYIDFSVFEILKLWEILQDKESGLFHQAREVGGRLAPGEVTKDNWSRGNGWGSMAFTALMRDLPRNHKDRAKVRKIAKGFYLACLKYQDENGLWHQEMTDHSSYVETSGSALVLAGIGAAIETGVISRKYIPAFEKGLKALLAYVEEDGSVGHTCCGNLAPGDGSKEAYKIRHFYFNEPHAFGPVVFALSQALRLGIKEVTLDQPLGYANAADKPRTYVRFITERKEDIAWENDLAAFRVYSRLIPNKNASGVDYWTKSVDYSIIDKWYSHSANGKSYHTDYGEGCDFYVVGNNRGLGGSGIYADGKLYASQNYANYRILRNDPDHIEFILSYQPYEVAGKTVCSSKKIEMVLGTPFYKVTETVETEDGSDVLLAVGLTTHGDVKVRVDKKKGLLGVSETFPIEKGSIVSLNNDPAVTSTTIYSSVFADPSKVHDMIKEGADELVLIKARSGESVVYYVGAGWSEQMYQSRFRCTPQYWNEKVLGTSWQELNTLYSK